MEPEERAPEVEYDSSGVDVTLIRWMDLAVLPILRRVLEESRRQGKI